ncbi:MAG: hypothetical protein IIU87_08280 [Prevotella sp.]|nr:hypothetical protein [Prevotella sp.]MBQ5607192.1 hypothetical protein [Prevotella sp.]MEE1092798.1 hypothetical protein [Prevotella sp.]
MRYTIILAITIIAALTSCTDNKKPAEELIGKIEKLYEGGRYTEALALIDTLRNNHPTAIQERKRGLRLKQEMELRFAQDSVQELDKLLHDVNWQYNEMKQSVDKKRAEFKATEEEYTALTKMKLHRDSIQAAFEVQCAKVRYIKKRIEEDTYGCKSHR